MAPSDQQGPLANKPLRLFFLAWILAGLLMTFLVKGDAIILSHRNWFGDDLAKLSLVMSNLVSEQSAQRPVE